MVASVDIDSAWPGLAGEEEIKEGGLILCRLI